MAIDGALALTEAQLSYLVYLAARIDHEVARFERGEQTEDIAQVKVLLLARLAADVLGTEDEVEAWLEAATSARKVGGV